MSRERPQKVRRVAWASSPARQGHERRLRAFIVNYADDFVILRLRSGQVCCRGAAEQAAAAMRAMMARLRLTVNESKTRVCRARQESVRGPEAHATLP